MWRCETRVLAFAAAATTTAAQLILCVKSWTSADDFVLNQVSIGKIEVGQRVGGRVHVAHFGEYIVHGWRRLMMMMLLMMLMRMMKHGWISIGGCILHVLQRIARVA